MSKLNVVFSEVKKIEKIEVADKVFELNEIYPYGDGGRIMMLLDNKAIIKEYKEMGFTDDECGFERYNDGNNIDISIDEVVCGIHVSLGEELYTTYYDSEGYELFEN
tara:strand:+ start:251 stop:571 length:321 start_codon:yes stop_codon:yes gene_type:complete